MGEYNVHTYKFFINDKHLDSKYIVWTHNIFI